MYVYVYMYIYYIIIQFMTHEEKTRRSPGTKMLGLPGIKEIKMI